LHVIFYYATNPKVQISQIYLKTEVWLLCEKLFLDLIFHLESKERMLQKYRKKSLFQIM